MPANEKQRKHGRQLKNKKSSRMADDLWAELQAEEERSKKAHRKRIEKREELAGGSVGEFQRLMLRINATSPEDSSSKGGEVKQKVLLQRPNLEAGTLAAAAAAAEAEAEAEAIAAVSKSIPTAALERKEESKTTESAILSKKANATAQEDEIDSDDEDDDVSSGETKKGSDKSSITDELLAPAPEITSANVATLLQRHVNALSSEDLGERRRALRTLHRAFGVQGK